MVSLQSAIPAILVALSSLVAAHEAQEGKHFGISLIQHRKVELNENDIAARIHHSVNKHAVRLAGKSTPIPIESETFNSAFWFGAFTVGDSENLSLLIDTGSEALAVNPGLYKPSSASIPENKTGLLEYGTWLKDGCGTAALKYETYSDTVSAQGLVAENMKFSAITNPPPPKNETGLTPRPGYPHQGIIGMTGGFARGQTWFQNVCDSGQVEECRFGLALGTAGKGKQVFGTVDTSLFEGELFQPDVKDTNGLQTNVVINGTTTSVTNTTIAFFDSGTADIVAPMSDVLQIFETAGIQAVVYDRYPGCDFKLVLGYYPCDKPPVIGLQFLSNPSESTKSSSMVFNIEPEAFQLYDNGNNNCTSTIVGWHDESSLYGGWIVGQAWYQGKYVDQNATAGDFGFAILKDKTGLMS